MDWIIIPIMVALAYLIDSRYVDIKMLERIYNIVNNS